jgi:hypothetical protein
MSSIPGGAIRFDASRINAEDVFFAIHSALTEDRDNLMLSRGA